MAKSAPAPDYTEPTAHLRGLDPVWARIVETVGECKLHERRRPTNFEFLARALVGQQISVAAAASIFGRLCEVLGGETTPERVLAAGEEQIRGAGLSRSKALYLLDLAVAAHSGEIEIENLDDLTDAEVIERLTAVRGYGVWTAEVFLVFQLGRPDVLPAGDGGLQRAVEQAWGLDPRPDEKALRALAEAWSPWRSAASWYLWASLRVELPA